MHETLPRYETKSAAGGVRVLSVANQPRQSFRACFFRLAGVFDRTRRERELADELDLQFPPGEFVSR